MRAVAMQRVVQNVTALFLKVYANSKKGNRSPSKATSDHDHRVSVTFYVSTSPFSTWIRLRSLNEHCVYYIANLCILLNAIALTVLNVPRKFARVHE